ncbi:MAG: TonB-dependent receptor [Flavobacterium sp. BFFFF2]|nr:MAG: TonB-dependent receptor [Flavobacterium sp. BFFFF2]
MKIVYPYLLCVTFFFCQMGAGQNTIQITDAKGVPLSKVTLHWSELKQYTQTDSLGLAKLPTYRAGEYAVECVKQGFKSQVFTIRLPLKQSVIWTLETEITELQEVLVTGVSRTTQLKEIPFAIQTITAKNWQQASGSNAVEALQQVAGVQILTTGTAIAKPLIRGLGYNRVISLSNGIRIEGQQWGDEHGLEMDAHAVDHVEIIKGPGSLWYGSDAMAGVIHFLASPPKFESKLNGLISQEYQSNARSLDHHFSLSGAANSWFWQTQGTHRIAGNFQNPADGYVLNSGFQEWDGMGQLGIRKNWGHSTLRLSTWNQSVGLPEGDRNQWGQFTYTDANEQTQTATPQDLKSYTLGYPQQTINHHTVNSQSFIKWNHQSISFDWGFQSNTRREYGNAAMPNLPNVYMHLNTLSWNGKYTAKTGHKGNVAFGISGMHQTQVNAATDRIIPNYQLLDLGTCLTYDYRFNDKWHLMGGGRLDVRWYQQQALWTDQNGNETSPNVAYRQAFYALNSHFNGMSGSVGTTFNPTKTKTIKWNVAVGYRAPNAAELSSNGKHEGTFRYELGNASLKPEHNLQTDVGFQYRKTHFTLDVSPFINLISNYIYPKRLKDSAGNDVIMDAADPVPTYVFTSGNSLLFGGEIQIDFHPHPFDWLHIEPACAFVRGIKQNDPTGYLPNMPAPQAKLSVRSEWERPDKFCQDLYFLFQGIYNSDQHQIATEGSTETETPAYALFHFSAGCKVKTATKSHWNLKISIENLLNTAYQNHLSRLKYAPINLATGQMGIFNPGRNYALRLQYAW